MIKVNLLPPEYRVPKKTPLPRFILIIFGIVSTLICLIIAIRLQISSIPLLESQLTNLKKEYDNLKEEEKEARKIQTEIDRIIARKHTLEDLLGQRVLLTDKLDRLCELIAPTQIWLNKLFFRKLRSRGRGKKKSTSWVLELNCNACGKEKQLLKIVAEFYEKIKKDPFIKKYFSQPSFSGIKTSYMRDIKLYKASFSMSMTLKSRYKSKSKHKRRKKKK